MLLYFVLLYFCSVKIAKGNLKVIITNKKKVV